MITRTVLVTGPDGFIGKNLCARLAQEKGIVVTGFKKGATVTDLKKAVAKADFVFHLAAVMRPTDEAEFTATNHKLTETLLDIISRTGRKIPVLLTSSIQAELGNPYGYSKKSAEDAVFSWARQGGQTAYVYRLPNVFGKWARPNYSSVVATFCHNIARNLEITIHDPQKELRLAYIDDVVDDFMLALAGKKKPAADGFCGLPSSRTFTVTLQNLANKIRSFKENPAHLPGTLLETVFDKALYLTYSSYMNLEAISYGLETNKAHATTLLTLDPTAHITIARLKPGETSGSLWHNRTVKKIFVVEGEGKLSYKNVDGSGSATYRASGCDQKAFDIPAGTVFNIKNVGEIDLLFVSWVSSVSRLSYSDTYKSIVDIER